MFFLLFFSLQQAADPEKASAEAIDVVAYVASVAPAQPEPAKKEDEDEDITKFREKVCNHNDLRYAVLGSVNCILNIP